MLERGQSLPAILNTPLREPPDNSFSKDKVVASNAEDENNDNITADGVKPHEGGEGGVSGEVS